MDRMKGAIAGIVGGVIGTYAMSEFQGLWSRAGDGDESDSAGGRHDARDGQERSEDENANERAAQAIATRAIGRSLDHEQLGAAAAAVPYGFGTTMGALYGVAAETSPRARFGSGAAFGAALWVGADEIAAPLFGLAGTENELSFELHAQALAAHIVYGVTTEVVRRVVRKALQ
jgi:hypothetical protein